MEPCWTQPHRVRRPVRERGAQNAIGTSTRRARADGVGGGGDRRGLPRYSPLAFATISSATFLGTSA